MRGAGKAEFSSFSCTYFGVKFTKFLVKEGINSMSLNPDSIMKVTLQLVDIEDKSLK
jgi:phosphoenolpyruvate synthase/pyruvate phosphate dikinase